MALKDKLMTLEDFKAVRDVDVASNTAQFTEIKADLSKIEPGLSDEAKRALLACFEKVTWESQDGDALIEALRDALGSGAITGNDLANIGYWITSYPYYSELEKRLSYPKLDIPVEGGKIYQLTVKPGKDGLNMYVNYFNDNVIAQAAVEGSISASDHMDAFGGWQTVFNQSIVAPKYINGRPTAGLIFGFKDANEANLDMSAIAKVDIVEKSVSSMPAGYTAYDYIAAKGSEATVLASYDGVIHTADYEDLSRLMIAFDFQFLTGGGTGNLPIIGCRSANNWVNVVCIYVTGGDDYTIYSHGAFSVADSVTRDKVNHIELRQESATPSVFVANGVKSEHAWENSETVNGPLYLLVNPIHGTQQTSLALSNYIQLGQFAVINGSDYDVYVPCVRNSDNVIGIFCVTSGLFYTCDNVNKAKINSSSCIYQVGNWS